jgi:hypothetical protein
VPSSEKEATVSKVEELSKAILRDLLADFVDQKRTVDDLANGYEGVHRSPLKQKYCSEVSTSEVDFDLALNDLVNDKRVDTGPMDFFHSSGNTGGAGNLWLL